MLADSGLETCELDDVHAFLPLSHYHRAVLAAIEHTGDPALGLHMGERSSMGSFDVLGHLSEQSGSLREALEVGVRYARIVSDGPRLELYEDAETATLRLQLSCWEDPTVQLCAEFATVSLLGVIRRFVGDGAQVQRVLFPYAAPAHRHEYTRIFGGREHFTQPFTGIEFDRQWLERTQFSRSTELRALLQSRAELLLAKVDRDAPAALRVQRWLASRDTRTRPTMDAIARDLGMSVRSLRRHLRNEDAAFTELVDDALALRAKRMLADPRWSIQETAYAMGFATASAFSRAFKRWTGVAPSAFRTER